MTKRWWQSNTIRVALAAILGAWAAYFGGQLGLQEAIMASVGALLAIFLRKGVGRPITPLILVGILSTALVACAGVPANVSPSVQGAQTLTGQQGQAAETGSATTYANPLVIYFFGGELSLKTNAAGETTVEASGAKTVEVTGSLTLGGVSYGEDSAQAEVSSGGGSAAGVAGGSTTQPKRMAAGTTE